LLAVVIQFLPTRAAIQLRTGALRELTGQMIRLNKQPDIARKTTKRKTEIRL